jgi:glyoxylase-like metal-dependent hydrolase (beta-lactamase superfamily II)
MNKVTVLVEGYAYPYKDGCYAASPTCTLVESGNMKFIVDPGTDKEKLLIALDKNNLASKDIDFIYLSHYHPDHWLNVRLFPEHDIYDGEICWRGSEEIFHKGKLPGTVGVEIIKTPGHATEHTSLLVDTPEGVVCISADVFWWEDKHQKSDTVVELLGHRDPFGSDKSALIKSRKLILEKADFVIPGHGKKFKIARQSLKLK